MNPYTQDAAADRRFLRQTLTRYGTVRESIVQVRKLKLMGEDGQAWWCYIEARLATQLVEDLCDDLAV